jgi:hypothetical protein
MTQDHHRQRRPRFSALVFTATIIVMVGCGSPDDTTDPTTSSSDHPLLIVPGADLRITSFGQTAQTFVDDFQQFSVTVANLGSSDANPTTLTVSLLQTQTSPQTFLLGSLQSVPSGCSLSGRTLTCALGRIRHNGPQSGRQRTVTFGYKIPVTTQALVLTASAAGTGEPAANATDNTATLSAAVNYRSIAIVPGTKTALHCTGTTLTAYFECTKFPSSIASHQADYQPGGTISFSAAPTYSGTWSQADPTRLHVEYNNGSYVEAIFDGRGADASCFEGITRFYEDPNPNDTIPPVLSSYVAPYRICN